MARCLLQPKIASTASCGHRTRSMVSGGPGVAPGGSTSPRSETSLGRERGWQPCPLTYSWKGPSRRKLGTCAPTACARFGMPATLDEARYLAGLIDEAPLLPPRPPSRRRPRSRQLTPRRGASINSGPATFANLPMSNSIVSSARGRYLGAASRPLAPFPSQPPHRGFFFP